jgi:hypothetical protein
VNHNIASMHSRSRGGHMNAHTLHGTYHPKDEEFMNKHMGTAYTGTLRHGIHDVAVKRGALQRKSHLCIPEKEFRGLSSSNSNSNSNAR